MTKDESPQPRHDSSKANTDTDQSRSLDVDRRHALAMTGAGLASVSGCLFGPLKRGGEKTPGACESNVQITLTSADGQWRQAAATPAKTSVVQTTTSPTRNPKIAWHVPTGENLHSPVVEDAVYVADAATNTVIAASPTDGTILWKNESFHDIRWPVTAAPDFVLALDRIPDEDIVVVRALDTESGREEWREETTASMYASAISPTVHADTAYVSTNTGIRAIDLETGDTDWTLQLAPHTIDHPNGPYWVTLWATPAIRNNTIYTFDINDNKPNTRTIYAITLDGELAWQQDLTVPRHWQLTPHAVAGHETVYIAVHAMDGHAVSGQSPAVNDDEDAGPNARLFALDAESGQERWVLELPDQILTPPAYADGVVFVGTRAVDEDAGRLLTYDTRTECVRWEYQSQHQSVSTPAVTPHTLYLREGPEITALRVADGTVRWHHEFEAYPSNPIVSGDTVYTLGSVFTDDPMEVIALQER